ncbi:hypothetical protein WMF37_01175 [Sorangium sp. So ce291]|uniref:hypothetical protein n=1 Tax=Sorangium sp. So ce291 TaxID=3133294 RepID=UPI003F61809F
MCCTFSPARLSSTLLYAGDAQRNGLYVHVLAYQNTASTSGPNAMILPIPATRLGPENAVDTRPFRTFLEDIREATRVPAARGYGPSFGAPRGSRPVVFDVGSYTVVLAESPRAVLAALGAVPEDKRPAINDRMLQAFEIYYPGWPVAVCCWNGDLQPEPLLWWYEPRFPEWLFAPALDAHDGDPPDLQAAVQVDHHLAFGSALRPEGQPVRYRDDAGSYRPLLPSSVRGAELHVQMSNGDFWARRDQIGGPALRHTPGDTAGAPIALNGWEGEAPAWRLPTPIAQTYNPPPPRWPVPAPPVQPPPEGKTYCASCQSLIDASAKLCSVCGAWTPPKAAAPG